jgi:4,5-DOPA dioxygenase extradiol
MSTAQTTPVFFIGHGSPMNAIESNSFTKSLKGLRELCPNPRAILCISAHWMTEGSWITHMRNPKTIHDFYGFPKELFEIQYPVPGSPEVAELVIQTATNPKVHPDDEAWGLDHGSWSVLRHIYPEAEIPVLQLSLYLARSADYHFNLGQQLRSLRDQGVLIVGSGNIVHNLRAIRWEPNAQAYPWAVEFDDWVKTRLIHRDLEALMTDFRQTESGKLSVPTMEHYYPLLYALGATDEKDELQFVYEGIQNGSISMRTLCYERKNI